MDDLLQRARHGDEQAFITLFERGKQALWRAAVAVLGNEDDASDALQETALKTWRSLPRFAGRSRFETWTMRILLRTSYDLLQKRQREVPVEATAAVCDTWINKVCHGCTALFLSLYSLGVAAAIPPMASKFSSAIYEPFHFPACFDWRLVCDAIHYESAVSCT